MQWDSRQQSEGATRRAVGPYGVAGALVALLALIGGAGYLSFVAFTEGILAPGQAGGFGLVAVAVMAGTASFFSPCSFTVLPSYLAFAGSASGSGTLPGTVRSGVAAAAGVATTVTVLGLAVAVAGTSIGADLAIGSDEPSTTARALRAGLGAVVLAMGVLQLADWSHRVGALGRLAAWAVRVQPEGTSVRSVYGYGAGYVLAGVG